MEGTIGPLEMEVSLARKLTTRPGEIIPDATGTGQARPGRIDRAQDSRSADQAFFFEAPNRPRPIELRGAVKNSSLFFTIARVFSSFFGFFHFIARVKK